MQREVADLLTGQISRLLGKKGGRIEPAAGGVTIGEFAAVMGGLDFKAEPARDYWQARREREMRRGSHDSGRQGPSLSRLLR